MSDDNNVNNQENGNGRLSLLGFVSVCRSELQQADEAFSDKVGGCS